MKLFKSLSRKISNIKIDRDSCEQLSLNKSISDYLKITNTSLSFQVEFYVNHLEQIKAILRNEQKSSTTAIEALLMNYNKKITEHNAKLKSAYTRLKAHYDQSQFDLSSNIDFLNNKLDKAKEDNFLLANAINEKNTLIQQIETDIININNLNFASIWKRENYAHYSEKRIMTCQNSELNYYQNQLAFQSKEHNKEIIKTSRLNTEVNEIKRKIKVTESRRYSGMNTQNDYNANMIKLSESSIDNWNEKANDMDYRFTEFEKKENDNDEKEITKEDNAKERIDEDKRNEIMKNDNRLLPTERDSYNNSNSKRVIPKLDLQQIEFNKAGVNRVIVRRSEINGLSFDNSSNNNSFNNSISIEQENQKENYDIQIDDIKKKIEKLRMKVLSNYELICNFKHFCYKFQSKYTSVELDLDSNIS